jgi:hypothetical protein
MIMYEKGCIFVQMKGGFLLISMVVLLCVSCTVDQRKAQWHCNAIVVQQQEIVDVWNRWDLCYADTFTFRYLNEKNDSIVLLLDRLDKTLDTLSYPDDDDQLVVATRQWSASLRKELLPLYQKKNDHWKMMTIWWSDEKTMEWKNLDQDIEQTKTTANTQMIGAVDDFVDDYNLSFSTP